ncbi:hypothetical protein GGI17_002723 [Coemansia sp. S146]|nr:hypothetical protein GGI17_002723 [Coemansia sp. S146]
MTSHAYFLIDAGTLSDSRAVGVMIARILVYLAAKNEAVTWNYEIVDMRARQRAAAVQLRRKVSERKQLTVDAISGLATALSSTKRQHIAAAAHRRPALDTLHERLMCLEADVEWEDPALIRSPTRNSSMRTWTDPTRLNESMSVRSYLYILGQAPQTLSELDDYSLLEDKVVYAQRPSHSSTEDSSTGSVLYAAIVPAVGSAAAVYFMDATTYAEVANFHVNDAGPPFASDPHLIASPFQASWIEDWAWRDAGDLDVASQDVCAIDVGFDESQFECPMSDQMPSDGFILNSSASADSSATSLLDTSAEFAIAEAVLDLALPSILTLSEWYSELYLKGLLSPAPEYSRIVDSLTLLCSTSAPTNHSNAVLDTLVNLVLQSSAAIEDIFEVSESTQSAEASGDVGAYRALRLQAAHAIGSDGPSKRAWQVRECQLQILLHLFVIARLRSQQATDTVQLEEALRDLVDLLCVWASLDDIAIQVEASSSDQKADKCPVPVSEETKDMNDFAAAFVGGSHVGRFASTLGDIVEELRIQCGWVPPATRDERPSQSEHVELLSETKRRKGTPRKIDKSSGERSEVIVHQRNSTHQELSGHKLARHLDELIGGNKGQQQQHHDDGASSSEGGSSPSFRAVERRRQSLQPRLPAHLIRQIKSEVVSTSQRAPKAKAVSRVSSNGFACSISSRTLGRSSSTRRKPLRKPVLSAYPDPSSSPSTSSRNKDSCIVSEAASLSKRRRTIMSIPMGSSPPAFLQSSLVTPSAFICGSDDEDGAPVHTLGSKRALQF